MGILPFFFNVWASFLSFSTLTTGNNDITIPESENTLEELNSYGTDLQETLKYYGITDNYKGLTENEARKILDILYRRRNESKQGISSESYGRSGRSLQNIKSDTDGIFIFRNNELSEIKIPRVVSEKTRSSDNNSITSTSLNVNTEIDQLRQQFENTDKWLKAPNGADSKLNEQQWLQVRTPSFKSWFGDWEKDPKNASKVVDENGEPMVVYHGTPHSGFSVFKDTQASGDRSTSMHFFSDNLDLAKTYSGKDADPVYETLSDDYIDRPAAIYRTFLNLRNPKIIYFRGRSWNVETNGQREYWYKLNKDSDWKKYEAADYFADGDTINEDNLIKYIKENDNVDIEGETDLYNAEYRTIEGLNVNTDEIGYEAKQEGYDGVIVKNVYDVGDSAWETAPTDPTTDYIVFKPNQIKSATHNSSDFSLSNDDIRFQTAYHGSSSDFEKFDLNYGLTGEGSMSFGYGVYVTESEAIARDYAERQASDKKGEGLQYDLESKIDIRNRTLSELELIENEGFTGFTFQCSGKKYKNNQSSS